MMLMHAVYPKAQGPNHPPHSSYHRASPAMGQSLTWEADSSSANKKYQYFTDLQA
jgi:hypothetical protein